MNDACHHSGMADEIVTCPECGVTMVEGQWGEDLQISYRCPDGHDVTPGSSEPLPGERKDYLDG